MGPFICDQTTDIFLLGILVCRVASTGKIIKQNDKTIMIITCTCLNHNKFCSVLWSDDWHYALTKSVQEGSMGPFICDQMTWHFLVWSTCMPSCYHWKYQQTKQWNCIMIITKIDVCQYLSMFVYLLCNFMLNNTPLLLLACAFVSSFD